MKKVSKNSNQQIKKELAAAIKKNEFILYYQPQFNLHTSKFESVEALIRWQHVRRGLLLPRDFFPIIEKDKKLMIAMSKWVISTACKQMKFWQEKGLPLARMAVNITEKDLEQKNFPEIILKNLQENNIAASSLEIELTENILFQNKMIIHNLHELKKIGVTIALDDFGTGYSSISHLKKLPIDKIKIAKIFIDHVSSDQDDAAIVKAIIQLADSLKIQVVVEGVESLKQLQLFLNDKRVEFQGFYFSEPLPAEEIEKIFTKL